MNLLFLNIGKTEAAILSLLFILIMIAVLFYLILLIKTKIK